MISWLNKQLNEKPGSSSLLTGGVGASSTTSAYSANKYNTLTASKPPTNVSSTTTNGFKPTFASIEQLNSGGNFERSPYRSFTVNNNNLNTPSSITSLSS